ncbi:MAG: NAD(P)H-hydrate dehydratase [Chloroflexi bacterium]|nr:NAD(P)H-hydrate dehydratase [Chloroflexota bacterium]
MTRDRVARRSRQRLDASLVASFLPDRPADGHKGTFGHVLAVAGSLEWAGAALLTGTAALRMGAGLATLALPASLQPMLVGRVPELMSLGLPETDPGSVDGDAAALVIARHAHRAMILGPGLRPGPGTDRLVLRLLEGAGTPAEQGGPAAEGVPAPAVIDATALRSLAAIEEWWERRVRLCVVTPHPGEFARLDGAPVGADDAQREERAIAAAGRWSVVVVLKGARTVVAAPDGRVAVSPVSNPALGTGGTGDVLSGVIASLLAQGVPTWEASCLGVYLHAAAGERVRDRIGDAGLLASDLVAELPLARRDLTRRTGDRRIGFAPR